MKLLILWHDLPSPFTGTSLPLFNVLKYLSRRHDITLLCSKEITDEARYTHDISPYCKVIQPVEKMIPRLYFSPAALIKYTFATTRNTFSLRNLTSKNPSFFDSFYSPEMQATLESLLANNRYDLIYTSGLMAHYAKTLDLPKVAHPFDCLSKAYWQLYSRAKNPVAKLYWWVQYLKRKRYEFSVFNRFDACIVVSIEEQKKLESVCPNTRIVTIYNGVDTEFFRPIHSSEQWPSLVFTGTMRWPENVLAIRYFYTNIYNRIKQSIPEVRLYVVGRDPTEEICRLSSDTSVIVTGYVVDIRSYVASASVVIAPFVSAVGVKNKVMEAMAMGKSVVTTHAGIQGTDAVPDRDIIVADEPENFALQVINLLNDDKRRREIGNNGRELVKTCHKWEKTAEQMNHLFQWACSRY
jgi:glycosyltransferase involved in cell wall biosynthesis